VTSVTGVVNNVLKHGDTMTISWLQEVTGIKTGVWKYLEKETFEEKDFPPTGITIDAGYQSIFSPQQL